MASGPLGGGNGWLGFRWWLEDMLNLAILVAGVAVVAVGGAVLLDSVIRMAGIS